MSKLKITDIIGVSLFCTGASTVDFNQMLGAVITLVGLGVLVLEAKREGMWR